MFAQVELPVSAKGQVLTVPVSAVIDSGTRQIVLVQLAAGRFEPRPVLLGERSNDFVAVREGLKEGELVVTAANFLIDAESNLKAALGSFGSALNSDTAHVDTAQAATKKIASVSHRADGVVDSVDAKGNAVTLTHGPVASLKWPGMTMEFKLANAALIKDLKPGAKVAIEFVERQPGEWVITAVQTSQGSAK
jgi:Cu(I)/Ag(I) efflux system membrane fusion protein